MKEKRIAEVVPLKIHLNKSFHYLIPDSLKKSIDIGKRVLIQFRNKKRVGIVINIVEKTHVENLNEIEEVVDSFPVLSHEVLALTEWISRYYLYPREVIINTITPSTASLSRRVPSPDSHQKKCKHLSFGDSSSETRGILRHQGHQQYQLFSVPVSSNGKRSGKDILFHYHDYQVRDRYYERWIRKTLDQGRQVLLLIPDQWSCIQLKKKLTEKYGQKVGIFDKKVSQARKFLRFSQVRNGEIMLVIGTRSNVFLPFQNLGLIIVEQENSPSYKEERIPRYHTREVALARGRSGACQVLLASFAPSAEIYWKAMNQHYIYKSEKNKARYYQNFPGIQVIDMKEEKSFQRIISFPLQQKMIQSLKEKKKIVLFLNRRGFAGYMICPQCGYALKCTECDHLLSYHVEKNTEWTVCHFCGKKQKMEKVCPKCGNDRIKPLGTGTQYVETLVRRMFPREKVQRLDIDSAPKIGLQQKIIKKFNRGEITILIGTYILFRELKYRNIGVISFIQTDHMLNIQDYRSAEIAFQKIYQTALNYAVQEEPKTMLLQTYQPEHHTLQAIMQWSYPSFFQKEMEIRKELAYPPFASVIKIEFIGKRRDRIEKSIIDFIDYFQKEATLTNGEFEGQLNKENMMIHETKGTSKASYVLKISPEKHQCREFQQKMLQYHLKYQSNDVKLVIDVNPMKMA